MVHLFLREIFPFLAAVVAANAVQRGLACHVLGLCRFGFSGKRTIGFGSIPTQRRGTAVLGLFPSEGLGGVNPIDVRLPRLFFGLVAQRLVLVGGGVF